MWINPSESWVWGQRQATGSVDEIDTVFPDDALICSFPR
jgi:hypothetical protein